MAAGQAIEKIESDFAKAGYRVSKKLFNVADYGAPQLRKRVIIAGTRIDLPTRFDFEFPEPTHADFAKKKSLIFSLGFRFQKHLLIFQNRPKRMTSKTMCSRSTRLPIEILQGIGAQIPNGHRRPYWREATAVEGCARFSTQ